MRVAVQAIDRESWRDGCGGGGTRLIPEETPLALTYNGGTYAVMMGTPQNLEDFAVGFSLSEGVVKSADDIQSLEVIRLDDGIELRMWLANDHAERISERRRHIAGPTGCGICGIESIAEAVRPAAIVPQGQSFTPDQIMTAMQNIAPLQAINMQTAPSMPPRSGPLPTARSRCVKMSAATTRSISLPAHWHVAARMRVVACCC